MVMAKSKEMYITHVTRQRSTSGGAFLLPPQKGKFRQMNAIEWLKGKLHIEPDERKIGKKYYEKCDKDTAIELETSYSTYMILKDRGYEPDDVLILLEEDNGKFTGKKLTVQVYSAEREIEGLLDGYCVLMVENMGLAAWKVK
jgi:hypothetical protein